MLREYAILLDENGTIHKLESMDEKITLSAVRALNTAAEKARTLSARAVLDELAFPASYVAPASGRLTVGRKANRGNLSSTVSARSRSTSLARFALPNTPRRDAAGVNVEVKHGKVKLMKGAFLIKLRSGSDVDSKNNLGLSVRTKDGRAPRSAYKPTRMKNGLWLLYGPSVAQALLNAKEQGIWPQKVEEISGYFKDEFNRLMEVDFAQ